MINYSDIFYNHGYLIIKYIINIINYTEYLTISISVPGSDIVGGGY
jgi:hypothetical protein